MKSRSYAKICDAEKAVGRVRESVTKATRVNVEEAAGGRSRVTVRGKTGAVLATSPELKAKPAAARALTGVRRAAPSAELVDARKK